MKKIITIMLLSPIALLANSNEVVSKIIDGDTIQMKSGKIYNLANIDAPEFKPSQKLSNDSYNSSLLPGSMRNYGRSVKNLLTKTIVGKSVNVTLNSSGKATINVDGYNLNKELVSSGLAVSIDSTYEDEAFNAEIKSKGFWKLDDKMMMTLAPGKAEDFDFIGTGQTTVHFLGKDFEIKQSRTFYS
ncbi:hypothetical protein HOK00_00265 [bacterium]|nr:hypothetical protein [bacterium]